MRLTLSNKTNFCNKFLVPIARVSDLAILTVESGVITSINKTADNNTLLVARCSDIAADTTTRTDINVPDVKKFVKAFDCIDADNITVDVNYNNIEYRSPRVKFKFHLLEDGIIAPLGHSIKKIENFDYDVHFKMQVSVLNHLMRSSTFASASDKVYFSTEDGGVLCELNDKSRHNLDSFTTQVADRYEGSDVVKPIPFALDAIRYISALRSEELDVRINTGKGVLCIDVHDEAYQLKYVSTSKVV